MGDSGCQVELVVGYLGNFVEEHNHKCFCQIYSISLVCISHFYFDSLKKLSEYCDIVSGGYPVHLLVWCIVGEKTSRRGEGEVSTWIIVTASQK